MAHGWTESLVLFFSDHFPHVKVAETVIFFFIQMIPDVFVIHIEKVMFCEGQFDEIV